MSKNPEVSPVIAASIICLVVGGAIGFFTKAYLPAAENVGSPQPARAGGPPAGMMGGPPAGMGGGPGGMGGGGGGGNNNSGGLALARMVSTLNTVELAQGKGLKPEQAKVILPILQKVKAADKIAAEDADKDIAAIKAVLTDDQKATLDAMTPQRGGGGGGGRGGAAAGGGAPGGIMPGGGPPAGTQVAAAGGGRTGGPVGMGGGGGGGQRPDPEKPFASERNSKALDSLITSLGK